MIKSGQFIIVYILLAAAGLYINFHGNTAVPVNKPFSEFPVENRGWRMVGEDEFDDRLLGVLKPTDYLSRQYAGPDGGRVELYMGYHDGGKESGEIHSPKHCLPGGGWQEISIEKRELAAGNKKIKLAEAHYQKGDVRKIFFYWFQVRGETISDEYRLKFKELMNSLFYSRGDSTFLRISVSYENDEESARLAGEKFIRDFNGIIQSFLPI